MKPTNPTQFRSYSLRLGAACFAIFLPASVHADPESLREPDRIALEEQLEKIEKRSKARVSGLYLRAIKDYRAAITSDAATMELYIKCVEKVRFEDEQRKGSEFREWKRKNKERLSSGSMRMALRHQLSWLLLSIEAAQSDGDISELGTRAITHLDQIFEHAEILKPHRSILDKNALSSVFARAYSLNIDVEDWPKSALDIGNIYSKVVMPPLKAASNVTAMRNAWKRRILHEGLVFEKWSDREGTTIGTKEALRPPELEKFLAERRPALLWKMEMDCFKAGDQRGAALEMIRHLETYITHKDAPEWIDEFKELISPDLPDGSDDVAGGTAAK